MVSREPHETAESPCWKHASDAQANGKPSQSLLRISGELDTAWAGITHDRQTASINACSMHGQSPSDAQHGVDR